MTALGPDGLLITGVGPEAREPVSQLIAAAFDNLPQTLWIEPDPDVRQVVFPQWFGLFVDQALYDAGHVDAALLDGQVIGAAIWLRAHPGIPEMATDYDERLAIITGDRYERFHEFDTTLERHHPRNPPTDGGPPATPVHLHLTMIAVDPKRQSEGIGNALLTHRHRDLDQQQMPAYLEASEPQSRRLYLRHGYTDLGEPFHLPDGPPMWPMWRDPTAATR